MIIGNWMDENAFEHIIHQTKDDEKYKNRRILQDSDGDFYFIDEDGERDYIPVEWYYIVKKSCRCSRFIQVIEKRVADFYENDIPFCRYCGWENWHKGIYDNEIIDYMPALEELEENGFEISAKNKEIIKRIYNL